MEINLEQLRSEQNHIIQNPIALPAYQPGRSIVTTCYRAELPSVFVLLSEIRRLDMSIPVEVFYRDDEINHDELQELQNLSPGQIVVKKIQNNVQNFVDRWGHPRGWGTKVLAILESQYEENLWIDCDNVPIKNCLYLFDDPEYQQKGSMFWRDVYSMDRADQYCSSSDMWKIFGVEPNDAEPFESGQILLNKPKVWTQLSLMYYFTQNCQLYYHFGGDAECWRMAWQRVSSFHNKYHAKFNYHESDQVPYGFMPYGPFHKGQQNPWHKYGGGSVMVQRDRKGDEIFNHRNLTKWLWTGENPFNEDVTNELNYHLIIRHLRSKYGIPSNG